MRKGIAVGQTGGTADRLENRRSERGNHALRLGLAERHKALRRRHEIRNEAVKIGCQRGGEADRLARRDNRDRDGISGLFFPNAAPLAKTLTFHCRGGDTAKRRALRQGLDAPFERGLRGSGQLGNCAKRGVILGARCPMGEGEEHRVVPACPFDEETAEPSLERRSIGDPARFDRPLDAARMSKSTNRIGWRKP